MRLCETNPETPSGRAERRAAMQYERKTTMLREELGVGPDLMTLLPVPALVARTVFVGGRRISVRLESEVWSGLIEIGEREAKSLDELCEEIDARRNGIPLATAVRVFVLHYFREAS